MGKRFHNIIAATGTKNSGNGLEREREKKNTPGRIYDSGNSKG